MKVGIVGAEESKWKSKEQIEKAKKEIALILLPFHLTDKVPLVSGHCPKGGVDIWAEEIADSLGIKKEIYRAEVEQWEDFTQHGVMYGQVFDNDGVRKLKGYKSRNIQIAETCDMLYCIVPKMPNYDPEYVAEYSQSHCKHCNEWGHPTNGGCWTMKHAKKLGKETRLIVIECG